MILCCGEALIDMLPCQSRENDPLLLPASAERHLIPPSPRAVRGWRSVCFPVYRMTLWAICCATRLTHPAWIIRPQPAPLPTTLAFVRLVGGQARYTFTMKIAPAEC